MRPFIVRFTTIAHARQVPGAEEVLTYDPSQEVAVLAIGDPPAIELPELAFLMTGSNITEARGDPTSDEPTDR